MNQIGTKKIITKNLVLRKFVMNDALSMYQNWASDDEVLKYLTWPKHGDLNASKNLLKDVI